MFGVAATVFILIVFTHHSPVSPVTLSPQVNVTEEHVTVVEGGRVILPCTWETVDTEDTKKQVIWVNPRKILISYHDRRMIDDSRISVERPYLKVWNLLIRTVRYNDSGVYECRVNTTPRQIKQVRLEVQVPPSIQSHLSSDKVTVQEGETATIVCNVTGIPPPNVTWFKRNYRIIGGKKERIGKDGEVLMIKNITRHCDDIYECYVDNGVPPAVSKAIRVIVDFSPEVVVPIPKRIGQRLHKETILECQIYANPQGVTTWKRRGNKITKNDKYDIEVIHNDMENSITLALRIRDLQLSDYGHYECVGSNYLGEAFEIMKLYEIKPPKTTTTTTTTTPAIVHVPAGHHQPKPDNNHLYIDDPYPHTNQKHQGYNGDNGDDHDYSHNGKGEERDQALREWEQQHRIGKDNEHDGDGGSDPGQTWSVFSSEDGNKSCRVNSCPWLTFLLLFIGYSLIKK